MSKPKELAPVNEDRLRTNQWGGETYLEDEPWTTLEVEGLPYPQPRPKVVGMGKPCRLCKKAPNQRVISMAGKLGKHCLDWRENVYLTAIAAGFIPTVKIPTVIEILFRLEPPSSLLKKDGTLTKSARRRPTGARDGDWDNLAKGTCDALNGVVFEDDSWIVDGRARKVWALNGAKSGATIRWKPAQEGTL